MSTTMFRITIKKLYSVSVYCSTSQVAIVCTGVLCTLASSFPCVVLAHQVSYSKCFGLMLLSDSMSS